MNIESRLSKNAARALKLLRILRRPLYRSALRKGVAAGVENEGFLRAGKFRTIIDAGANKGQFALVARSVFPDAQIYSIEPVAAAATTFRSIFSADSRAQLFQMAVGREAGEVQIAVPPDSSEASLLVPLSNHVKERVRVERLDTLLDPRALVRPVLLKMDLQGFELEALNGATDLLPVVDDLFLEVTFWSVDPKIPTAQEIISWVTSKGFVLAGIYNPVTRDSASFAADLHFARAVKKIW